MKRPLVWTALAIVFAGIGAVLSGALFRMHYEGKAAIGLLADACGGEASGCDAVISSRWSVFPPAAEEGESSTPVAPVDVGPVDVGPVDVGPADVGPAPEPAGAADRAEGIPVAAFGLFYYLAVLLYFICLGPPRPSWRRLHLGVLGLCVVGTLGSIWFIVVMGAFIGAWCPLCLGSHAANFLLLGSVVMARPGRPAAAEGDAPSAAEVATASTVTTGRLLGVTALAVVLACLAGWYGLGSGGENPRVKRLEEEREELLAETTTLLGQRDKLAEQNTKLRADLNEFLEDREKLESMYFSEEQVDLGVEDHHPMIVNAKKPRMTLTYFSDLECPSCARFDTFIFEEILPLYNGHLRVVFKHLPLTGIHPNAMRAARAAEAAHLQGKFWEAKSWIIERRTRLRGVDYGEMAQEIGIDAQKLLRDMSSIQVKRRIDDDIRIANQLRLTATPTVYLNSRLVKKIFRKQIGFWELRVESLRKATEQRGQQW